MENKQCASEPPQLDVLDKPSNSKTGGGLPLLCPSSPPPDAVWTLERILQNPPSAPKRRSFYDYHQRPSPPRHRRSISNIPDDVLSAWPSNNSNEEDDDEEGEMMREARSPLMFLSPTSSTSSSFSNLSLTSSSSSATPTVHSPRPSRAGGDPRRRFAAVADPRLLFQHHSTSQLYVRPAPTARKQYPLGYPTHRNPHHGTTTVHVTNHNINNDDCLDGPDPSSGWEEEEDRQGSTRHLFERRAGHQQQWSSDSTTSTRAADLADDDPRI